MAVATASAPPEHGTKIAELMADVKASVKFRRQLDEGEPRHGQPQGRGLVALEQRITAVLVAKKAVHDGCDDPDENESLKFAYRDALIDMCALCEAIAADLPAPDVVKLTYGRIYQVDGDSREARRRRKAA